jgi:multicomponent Na+:H+ antiporter subunit B
MAETSVPNIVTAVLADYRGYDTMFETTVIFAAGVACFFLLRSFEAPKTPGRTYRHLVTGMVIEVKKRTDKKLPPDLFQEIDSMWTPHDLIIMTMSKILAPFIQLFGLYVIAHGHHSPGGGFQGGVILGASVILLAICFDLRTVAVERLRESLSSIMSATGVFIYAGVGAIALAMGSSYLDYGALAPLLYVDPVQARSLGIFFVEVGVGLTVTATMVLIYNNLASAGLYNQGL